jgi:ZIP family zinc transporter
VNEAAAAALAVGIAIQNFPEGAIISLPLRAGGMSRTKSFLYGAASGAVEPIGAAVTIAAAALIIPAMPYLLSFAAGAMIYVTVADMIPGIAADGHSVGAALSFSVGFVIMMSLDVALG